VRLLRYVLLSDATNRVAAVCKITIPLPQGAPAEESYNSLPELRYDPTASIIKGFIVKEDIPFFLVGQDSYLSSINTQAIQRLKVSDSMGRFRRVSNAGLEAQLRAME
jgi:hypothetical protein